MKQSHRELLASGLPADMQASFLESAKDFSPDGNDPVEAYFAAVNEPRRRDTKAILEILAASEKRYIQLRDQIVKNHNDHNHTLKQELNAMTGNTHWRRIFRSKIAGGIIIGLVSTGCAFIAATMLIAGKLQTVTRLEAQQTAMIDDLEAKHAAALKELSEKNGILDENPKGMVDFTVASLRAAEKSNKTAATLAGIASLLATPDTVVGMRKGKLTVKIRPENVQVSEQLDGFIHITINQELPEIFGGIEDDLREAEKALKQK